MRIATLILALVLMVVVGMQSCALGIGGSIAKDESLSGGGGLGFLVTVLYLIGAAFAVGKPSVSMFAFLLAAFFAFIGGSSTKFHDLTIWGFVSLFLVALSFLGWRERRRPTTQSSAQAPTVPGPAGLSSTGGRFCSKCGRQLAADAAFCPGCGTPVSTET